MKVFRLETQAGLEKMQLLALALFLVLFFSLAALTPADTLVGAEPDMASAALIASPRAGSAISK